MNDFDRLTLEHLLTRIDDLHHSLILSLRIVESSRKTISHERATDMMQQLAALDLKQSLRQAVATSHHIEQLLATLRGILPEIDNTIFGVDDVNTID
jgi:hypothetical protein